MLLLIPLCMRLSGRGRSMGAEWIRNDGPHEDLQDLENYVHFNSPILYGDRHPVRWIGV